MPDQNKRDKLTIKQLTPEREVDGRNGKVKVLDFLAVNSAGQQFKYGIYAKTDLFPYIKAGQTIDCDVSESPSKQVNPETGNPYTNRNVVQVYVDGKPVSEGKRQGWQPRQDSPEQRRSIERQVAAKIAFANLPPPATIAEGLHLAEAVYQWISEGKFPPAPPATRASTTSAASTPGNGKPPPATAKPPQGAAPTVAVPPASKATNDTKPCGDDLSPEVLYRGIQSLLKAQTWSVDWVTRTLTDMGATPGTNSMERIKSLTPQKRNDLQGFIESAKKRTPASGGEDDPEDNLPF